MMNDALACSPDVLFVVIPIVTDNAEIAARMIDRVIREKEDPLTRDGRTGAQPAKKYRRSL